MSYQTSIAGIEPTFNPTASGRMDLYCIAVLVRSVDSLADEVGEFLAGHVRCELDEERRQQHERAAGRRHTNHLPAERLLYVAVF
jgi:hypothetical protein